MNVIWPEVLDTFSFNEQESKNIYNFSKTRQGTLHENFELDNLGCSSKTLARDQCMLSSFWALAMRKSVLPNKASRNAILASFQESISKMDGSKNSNEFAKKEAVVYFDLSIS